MISNVFLQSGASNAKIANGRFVPNIFHTNLRPLLIFPTEYRHTVVNTFKNLNNVIRHRSAAETDQKI
jgi:hypothetical protein